MKRINLFNATKKFRWGFEKECPKRGIELSRARTRFMILHLKDGEDARFVSENELFDLRGALNFFQMRGYEALLPSMMVKYCENNNIYFNDPVNKEHTKSVGKMMQMFMMHMNDLPIPETLLVNSFAYESNKEYILKNISFPLVLKADGNRGRAVWKIDNLEELDERLLLSEEKKREVIESKEIETYLLQEYIPNTHDFRVSMFEGEVLGVIKRSSKDGFYNNYCKGADWEFSEVTDEEAELCRKACAACGVDLSGVDFVRTEDGIKFFEANKSPMLNKDYSEVVVRMLDEKYF